MALLYQGNNREKHHHLLEIGLHQKILWVNCTLSWANVGI
jgi:hypothetical protein